MVIIIPDRDIYRMSILVVSSLTPAAWYVYVVVMDTLTIPMGWTSLTWTDETAAGQWSVGWPGPMHTGVENTLLL